MSLFNIRPIGGYTWFLVLSSITFVILGYLLVSVYKDEASTISSSTDHPLVVNDYYLILTILILSTLSLIGTALRAYDIANLIGGYEDILTRPLVVRNTVVEITGDPVQPPPVLFRIGGYLNHIGLPGVFFGALLFTRKGAKCLIGLIPVLAGVLAAFIQFSRHTLMVYFILWAISFIYITYHLTPAERNKSLLRLLGFSTVFLAIVAAAFYGIFYMRFAHQTGVMELFIEHFYLYLVGGLAAFDIFLKEMTTYTYGQETFRSVISWLARIGIWDPESAPGVHSDFVKVTPVQALNTYTFAKRFFEDFGIWGVTVVSFAFGAVTRWMVDKALEKFSFFRLLGVSVFTFTLILSFFGFYLSGFTTIFVWLFTIYIVDIFWGRKLFPNA